MNPNTPSTNETPTQEPNSNSNNAFIVWLDKMYERFLDFVKIQENDPIPLYVVKLGVRFVGIIIMLALSPDIILGFFIALMIAS